jgi:DDE superfamily endonuclease
MPGIVEFPKLVQDALAQYGDLFANDCQRRHLGEYLTGLFVAERKTVLGIHDEFAATTDQSCLNRFLTEARWDAQALNDRRLERLQHDPSTRYSDQGVIPIDNTLIDRDGMLLPPQSVDGQLADRSLVIGQADALVHEPNMLMTTLGCVDDGTLPGRLTREVSE